MDSLPTSREEYRAWWEANAPVPYGYCWCRCGDETTPAKNSDRRTPTVKGEPLRFRPGHMFKLETRYLEEDRGHDTPCWIWQLSLTNGGYGRVTVNGIAYSAHRYFYEKYKGRIPPTLTIDHLCRVRSCVNPDHLEAVSLRTNLRRSPHTVLSPEKVEALRDARKRGVSFINLEILTGIKRSTLQGAMYGDNWSKAD